MGQNYGGMGDIKKHFEYLLPFFEDSRYIKIDNKPVFLFYRANSITYYNQLINEWSNYLLAKGFSGLYSVETLTGFQKKKYSKLTEACVYMEPMYSLSIKKWIEKHIDNLRLALNMSKRVSYSSVWDKILKYENVGPKYFGGAFVDWDNSARKKNKNLVFKNVSIDLFSKYFSSHYQKVRESGSPFVFINAWNEWAEGTYLEPDEKYRYGFLENIKRIVAE